MQEAQENLTRCPHCGHSHTAAVDVCAACGAQLAPAGDSSQWSKDRDSLKTRWVASVLGFWVSVAVLIAVYFIKGELELILVSICLGLLIVGVWLKTRYQAHLRSDPDGH